MASVADFPRPAAEAWDAMYGVTGYRTRELVLRCWALQFRVRRWANGSEAAPRSSRRGDCAGVGRRCGWQRWTVAARAAFDTDDGRIILARVSGAIQAQRFVLPSADTLERIGR